MYKVSKVINNKNFNPRYMKNFCGKQIHISYSYNFNGKTYLKIKEDNERFNWTRDMLEYIPLIN